MIVVADSSPLHYLILIRQIELLHTLYSEVLVPTAMISELQVPQSPQDVRSWLEQRPSWLRIMESPAIAEEDLSVLGAGEREAIHLAKHLGQTRYSLMTARAAEQRRNETSTSSGLLL